MHHSPRNLRTLVQIARSLHEVNPNLIDPNDNVIVTPDLLKITEAEAAKSLAGRITLVGGRYPVTIARVNKAHANLYSQVWIEVDRAVVEFASDLNKCWSRFCVAKELLHIYTGCDGALDSQMLVKLARDSRFVIPENGKEMDDETFCLFLAIEVMLPWAKRDALLTMKEAKATPYQMAKHFMVPVAIIDCFFESGYSPLSYEANRSNAS